VKLVDFGLAIVADQAAQAKGEIWGTPYYIAPEKLDNQPEDFRSDIYSLGGTLFHALAGRPPYEAETASMVALKQLKSQSVSLQAFAPDISSETAYVINRMLSKNPDDRYQSYAELVEHLRYARAKMLERAQKPLQPKARVVLETQETKNVTALLSLGLLAAIVLIGLTMFLFRDKIFPQEVVAAPEPEAVATHNDEEFQSLFDEATKMLVDRNFEEARIKFDELVKLPGQPQPLKNWSLLSAGLASILSDQRPEAAQYFGMVTKGGLYTTDVDDANLASFFVDVAKQMGRAQKVVSPAITTIYSNQNFEAFGLMIFGLHNWHLGKPADGGPILKAFMRFGKSAEFPWIEEYKTLVKPYADDWTVLQPLEGALARVKGPASATPLLKQVKQAREKLQSGTAASDRLDQIETELIAKGAK
jgi:eukaryotic-like serine/threonine-protein kinase